MYTMQDVFHQLIKTYGYNCIVYLSTTGLFNSAIRIFLLLLVSGNRDNTKLYCYTENSRHGLMDMKKARESYQR